MIRTHVTDIAEPFQVVPCEQTDGPSYKPKGFWWEVDGDWRRWCADEDYGHSEGHLFTVDLGRSRILSIATIGELDTFHREWSEGVGDCYLLQYIRWDRVAEIWDGIEIAPYLWGRRLDGDASRWYYAWDCASGVVWNPVDVRLKYLETYVLSVTDQATDGLSDSGEQ